MKYLIVLILLACAGCATTQEKSGVIEIDKNDNSLDYMWGKR